jgi:hypothetical protein
MADLIIHSFPDLHEVLSAYRNDTVWVFRGHSNSSWPLIPKAGRAPFTHCDDRDLLSTWKRRAVEYTTIRPKDDWDWLAIAQHHGLATRLLDWTMNPLVAAFFAVNKESPDEAAIYAYRTPRVVIQEKISPWDCEGIAKFRPYGVASRIVRQDGLFTIHNPPTSRLEDSLSADERLDRIVIPASYQPELLYELFQYGVTTLSLFPDLDGLSSHINWYISHMDRLSKL